MNRKGRAQYGHADDSYGLLYDGRWNTAGGAVT